MKKDFCPNCGSKMIDDAFEKITHLPNGAIQLDTIYPAWVCSKFCGYYERLEEKENNNQYDINSVAVKLKELNFSKVLQLANQPGGRYSFDLYRSNGLKHNVEGFCTSCEDKGFNYSQKSPDYKLSTISHGTHTADFLEAMGTNKPDVTTWHEQAVMFIFESPSIEDKKYELITHKDINKKPVKEWYWIHKDKEYAEFPKYFEGKHYGNLVLSLINTFQLKNAYITNLVKCGLNNQQGKFKGIEHFSSDCIRNCFETTLKKEIEILKPNVIFSFGKKVKDWLKILTPDVPVYYLPHPAGRTKNKVRKLFYYWEVAQGLYDTGVINEEEVEGLSVKYLRGSRKQ
jgi:hypothetical protein